MLRPLRTVPIVRRRCRDRVPGPWCPLCGPPSTQQARLASGVPRQSDHYWWSWANKPPEMNIRTPNDLLKLSFDVRISPEACCIFFARPINTKGEGHLLRVMGIVRRAVWFNVIEQVSNGNVKACPLDGHVLRSDASLPDGRVLSFMSDWRVLIFNGHGSVLIASLRSIDVPNSVGFGGSIINDQKLIEEAFGVQFSRMV